MEAKESNLAIFGGVEVDFWKIFYEEKAMGRMELGGGGRDFLDLVEMKWLD